ncbi:12201_t:CDS:2 [Entrophospora sp. SA101]|nr:12201_t:CDS:2 [Entrophospora sp. SA101]
MTKQTIQFKKTNVNNNESGGPLELSIETCQFPTKEGSKAVTKIFFVANPNESGRQDLKTTLASANETFQLEYDDEEVEVEKNESGMEMKSSSEPATASVRNKITHKLNADNRELRIFELNLITITPQTESSSGQNTLIISKSKPTENTDNVAGRISSADTGNQGNRESKTNDNNSSETENTSGTGGNGSNNTQTTKNSAISEITTLLNQDPKEDEINNLKDRIAAVIKAKREQKQTDAKLEENLRKANQPTATIDDKKEAITEIDKSEGQQSYEEKKPETAKIKEEIAQNNIVEYQDKVISSIASKLTTNEVKENELDAETQREVKDLRDKKIVEPEKLVAAEMRIAEKIGKKGAEVKVNKLTQQAEEALKSKNTAEIERLKKELLIFISSSNVYNQTQKSKAEELISKLEKASKSNNKNNSSNPNKSEFP